MHNKLIIIGCGGHAKSVADVYLLNYPEAELVFVDSNAQVDEKILDFPVVKTYDILDENFFVAIGDNIERKIEAQKYDKAEKIVSKNSYLGKNASLGNGVFVAHNAHIGIESTIGDASIVNTGASIDHEVTIGENCHIAPNATICGRCRLGDNVFVGAGSVIIEKIKICNDVIIGAGSVVIKDILESGIYVGTPIRKIK